ncbi:MAG: hypothetical protein Q9205_007382 [Flavoplaca limonia]
MLTTKFAIEKARLLIWGESVGILSTTAGNTRVESPHVRPIIEQTLNCIRMLFEDTNALTANYGLKPTGNDVSSPSLALIGPSGTTQSVALPLRLKASYIRFKSRIDQTKKQISATKKTKWAVHDKQKFMTFVGDIHQFINGLEAITDSVEMATKRAAFIREELSTVEDPEDLQLIAEACENGNQPWSDAASIALGASVCGASNYNRIREWMRANSDVQMSTIVDYAESDPALDWSETTGFPYRNHDGFGYPIDRDTGYLYKNAPVPSPSAVRLAHQTPKRLTHSCISPACHRTFESIVTLENHLKKDHNTNPNHWRCVIDDCPSRNDEAWTRFDEYRLHCRLKHPDTDENELVKRAITDTAILDGERFPRLIARSGNGKVYRDLEL